MDFVRETFLYETQEALYYLAVVSQLVSLSAHRRVHSLQKAIPIFQNINENHPLLTYVVLNKTSVHQFVRFS